MAERTQYTIKMEIDGKHYACDLIDHSKPPVNDIEVGQAKDRLKAAFLEINGLDKSALKKVELHDQNGDVILRLP